MAAADRTGKVAGYQGTFVISWNQTETDGRAEAPVSALGVGSNWQWRGDAVRVDGASDMLVLEHSAEVEDLRRHAAALVHKLLGAIETPPRRMRSDADPDEPLFNACFEITDGRRIFRATIISPVAGTTPLLMFVGAMPPADTDHWVVRAELQHSHVNRQTDQPAGMVGFTADTRIRLADGAQPVETLREGDRIQTKDNGVQEVQWIGRSRISGARMHAMPDFRPVRLRRGALGPDTPDTDLLVSPRHRINLRDRGAPVLFNSSEVLVEARDLIDGHHVHLDHSVREVTYIHILLNRHEIIWANGVETESFHPASAALDSLAAHQRALLFERFPDLEADATSYGDYARRQLSRAEVAIMGRDVA